ncbi:MAG: MFS transporter [Acidimicrobiia bacterium]
MSREVQNTSGTAPGTERVLVAALAMSVTAALPPFLVGALAVQIRADLGFDATGLGVAFGTFGVAAALSSALLGHLVERIGPHRSMRIASVVAALAMVAIAAWASSLTSLAAILVVAGVANALAQPAANALVARGIPTARHGAAFGIKQAGMPSATLLAGATVPLLALTVGWRWAFVAGAAIGLGSLAAVPRAGARTAGVPSPTDPGEHRAEDRDGSTGRAQGGASARTLVVLAVGVGLGATAASALVTFLVSGAVHVGIGPGPAGWLLTAGSIIGISVRLRAGVLADRRDGRHLRIVSLMMLGGAGAFALFAFDVAWLYVVATALAFGTGWAWPGLFNFAVVRARPDGPGAATGLTQPDVGAWLMTAGFALAAAGTVSVGRRRVRRDRLR